MADARGASGFSFVEIAADRAGARFASGVLNKQMPLRLLAESFSVSAFMPKVDSLPEGLSADQFRKQFGATRGPRDSKQVAEIDQRILTLPPYKPSTLKLE
jgi:hypothetical protein